MYTIAVSQGHAWTGTGCREIVQCCIRSLARPCVTKHRPPLYICTDSV